MKKSYTKDIIQNTIYLLIPLIIYGIYKNGFLLYQKDMINIFLVFKPLYLVIIAVAIKLVIDLIKNKKISFDYNLVYAIIIAMIVPANINVILFLGIFLITYILSLILEKYIKFNKVCFIYLIIILIHFIFNDFTFKSILESNYSFSFNFFDLIFGRTIGGISSTNILFVLISYLILINSIYYKKDIPLIINITYILLALIYSIIFQNTSLLLNSELIFGSIFVSSLPMFSPYNLKQQYIFSILIGVLSFVISIIFNPIISIYLSTFIVSLLSNIKYRQNKPKSNLVK